MANHSSSERSCPALEADWTGVLYIQGLYHLGDGAPDRIDSSLRSSPVDSVRPAPRPSGSFAVQIGFLPICRDALRASVGLRVRQGFDDCASLQDWGGIEVFSVHHGSDT